MPGREQSKKEKERKLSHRAYIKTTYISPIRIKQYRHITDLNFEKMTSNMDTRLGIMKVDLLKKTGNGIYQVNKLANLFIIFVLPSSTSKTDKCIDSRQILMVDSFISILLFILIS